VTSSLEIMDGKTAVSSRRWFHPNITGFEAEELLLEKGQDGSFLCRPSNTDLGDFTLSVRRGGLITHVKIKNNGDHYDLHGGETFASLSDLVNYYMDHELKEKTGEIIQLRYPMNSQGPTNERWYHGLISGKEAERLLLDRGKNGSFLVRESSSSPGDYVLSARSDDNVVHIMLRFLNGQFDAGGGTRFSQLADLVDYYKKNPMIEKAGGSVVHLKAALNATRVTASKLNERVKELMKEGAVLVGKSGFWEEFEQLQRQEEYRHMYTRHEGQKPENKSKNRYKYILPFDHTRVKLNDVDVYTPGSDYINANYIEGEGGTRYIATQGCLPDTIDDFWRMVYFENSHIILNVTKEVERGRAKCAKYWPIANNTMDLCNFTVKNSTDKETPEYIFREFDITYKKEPKSTPKRVCQYHYTGWPEHGAPPDPSSVLEMLHDICLCNRSDPGPIIVHCSAGIGRTGTFIVIDILLGLLQTHGLDCEIDIPNTILIVRSQRSGMVQTETQYKFIYLALEHYVETEKSRQGIATQLSQNAGAGPSFPSVSSTGRRSLTSTGEPFFGNDRIPAEIERRIQSNDPPPPVPERRPVLGSKSDTQPSSESPNEPNDDQESSTNCAPPPRPSKIVAPPIPPRTGK